MADHQSIDGSLGRETDTEEKSLQSNEDMLSMITDPQQEQDVAGIGTKNDNSNEESDSEKRPADTKNGDEDNDDDENEKSDDDKGNTSDTTNDTKKEGKKKAKQGPNRKKWNDPTLFAIEKYIRSDSACHDVLEYEDISTFCTRIHRYAVERTRGRQGVLFRDATMKNGDDINVEIDPIIVTEEDAIEEMLYNQIYQKEEFHAVATEFFKTVVDGSVNMADPSLTWHTKTANWLKRAAGMQRHYDPYEQNENQQYHGPTHSDDSDDGEGENYAGTPGRGEDAAPARVTRGRIRMTRKKRRQERIEREAESFRILSEVSLELSKQPDTGRTKKGVFDATNDDSSDVAMMDAEEDVTQGLRSFPSLNSTGLTRILGQHQSNMMTDEADDNLNLPCSIETPILPSAIARHGLEFRQPPPKFVRKRVQNIQQDMASNKNLYAEKSKVLRNALSNRRARNWAIHEFFYSDLDREWYKNDGFVSDLVKLGLPINTQTPLTKQEQNLIRRKIQKRPRLFSKRFIAEQLKKRNRHRALVRRLQHDQEVLEFSPISVGTAVIACHKEHSVIAEGRILLYDPKYHKYLVQFNEKELGCKVCLDSEVAVSKSKVKLDPPTPLYEPCKAFSSEVENENIGDTELVIANRGNSEELERVLLNTLLAVTTEAFERKRKILEVLEQCSESSKHMPWLLANLDRNNRTLETARIHLKVLYGSIYRPPVADTNGSKVDLKTMKLGNEIPKTKSFNDFMESLTSICDKVCGFAGAFAGSRANTSGSTKLLLLANYLAVSSSSLQASGIDETTYSSDMGAALKLSLDKYANQCLPPTPITTLVGDRLEEEAEIETELKDLGLAVGALRAEVAVATDESRSFELNCATA